MRLSAVQLIAAVAVVGLLAFFFVTDQAHVAPRDGRPLIAVARLARHTAGASKVRLGTSTRDAVRAPADGTLELPAPSGSARFVFSVGVRAAAKANARFVVETLAAGSVVSPVFDEVLREADTWIDHEVVLEDDRAGDRVLRLRAIPATPDTEAYWGAAVVLARAGVREDVQRRPAVILISLDTLGADHVDAYRSDPRIMPRLDALLDQSFAFTRAYAQYPNTLVSHATLFTGLYPKHHGVYGGSPRLRARTLATMLSEQGYLTAAFTEDAFISSDFGFDAGFDAYDNGNAKTSDTFVGDARATFAKTRQWLDRRRDPTRFFLFVHTYEVHTPYIKRDRMVENVVDSLDPGYRGKFWQQYPGRIDELANNSGKQKIALQDLRHIHALYVGEMSYLDRVFGELLDYVRTLSYPCLLIVTSDHGEEFGEHGKLGHGETLHNEVLRVPLGFYWPGHTPRGTNAAPVQLADVTPTILELLGLPAPSGLDGTSLAPAVLGRGPAPDGPVFAELPTAWGDCRGMKLPDGCALDRLAVQTERFKLITSALPPSEALYDVVDDPGEMHAVNDAQPEELARHRALLEAYRRDIPGRTGGGPAGAAMDDATRERLRALGYIQ